MVPFYNNALCTKALVFLRFSVPYLIVLSISYLSVSAAAHLFHICVTMSVWSPKSAAMVLYQMQQNVWYCNMLTEALLIYVMYCEGVSPLHLLSVLHFKACGVACYCIA